MLALIKTLPGPGATAADVPTPTPRADEAVVRVAGAGICGTDVGVFNWAPNLVPRLTRALPLVMGHEFAGEVVEVGPGVSGVHVGDRVTGNPQHYCGVCRPCLEGRTSICGNRPTLGIDRPGTFAEFVAVRASNLFRVPDSMPLWLASLSDTVAGAAHAIERVGSATNGPVLVVGCGPLGLVLAMVLRASGVEDVIVAGRTGDERRLAIAKDIGARPLDVDAADPLDTIRDWTHGEGVSAAVEIAGTPEAVSLAIAATRRGGRVGLMGLGSKETSIATSDLVWREVDLVSICAYYPSSWDRTIELLARDDLPLQAIVTHRLPLADFDAGMGAMIDRSALKVILIPDEAVADLRS